MLREHNWSFSSDVEGRLNLGRGRRDDDFNPVCLDHASGKPAQILNLISPDFDEFEISPFDKTVLRETSPKSCHGFRPRGSGAKAEIPHATLKLRKRLGNGK